MISLVMATYNGESFIEEQLDSIRLQTMLPEEVVVADDCSTDKTYEIIEKYITKYKLTSTWRILKNTTNKGYSKNFTDAMKMVSGDIIFLADQDDIWKKNKIETMFQLMQSNKDILLLASNVVPFYEGNNPQKVSFESFGKAKKLVHVDNIYKWIKPIRPGCSMCFRRDLLKYYNQIWFDKYPHDCLLWGIAVLQGKAFLYNRTTLYFRRHDHNASSRSMFRKKNRLKILNMEIHIIQQMLTYQEMNFGNNRVIETLKSQLLLYKKRYQIVESGDITKALLMLPNIKKYGRNRFWLTDIYYCIK